MEMKTILVALAALGLAGSAFAQTSVIIRKADNSGPVPADASGVQVKASSLPLPSGASTAAKQPALGTAGAAAADVITIQGISSMTAVKVDGSGAIQPASQSGTWNINNVSGTVSLPTGAATSAKQPALGTAGAASADVITIQGVASMTAVKTDGSAVTQPVSGTVTANQGGTWTVQPGNTANTTAWKVDGSAVTQPASIADGSLVTLGAKADAKSTATDTTAITAMQVLKEISAMEQAPASRAVTNAGTFATQSAVTAASGAFASGSVASGAFASGSVASGAVAAGALADGADTTLGAKADAADCTTAHTLIACERQLHADLVAATPAGTNAIGALTSDSHAQCGALCANLVVKASSGVLKTFEVSADSTLSGAIWYVIVYDATSAPVDGAIAPAKCYQQASGTTQMGGTLGPGGSAFTTGITIGVSSTGCFSKTASTHAFIGADFQ